MNNIEASERISNLEYNRALNDLNSLERAKYNIKGQVHELTRQEAKECKEKYNGNIFAISQYIK